MEPAAIENVALALVGQHRAPRSFRSNPRAPVINPVGVVESDLESIFFSN
jgi:hypothetical protein